MPRSLFGLALLAGGFYLAWRLLLTPEASGGPTPADKGLLLSGWDWWNRLIEGDPSAGYATPSLPTITAPELEKYEASLDPTRPYEPSAVSDLSAEQYLRFVDIARKYEATGMGSIAAAAQAAFDMDLSPAA